MFIALEFEAKLAEVTLRMEVSTISALDPVYMSSQLVASLLAASHLAGTIVGNPAALFRVRLGLKHPPRLRSG